MQHLEIQLKQKKKTLFFFSLTVCLSQFSLAFYIFRFSFACSHSHSSSRLYCPQSHSLGLHSFFPFFTKWLNSLLLFLHLFLLFFLPHASHQVCQDICDLMLGTYVNIELANLLRKRTLHVIKQIQDVFNASRNKISRLSVKTMQVYPRNK